MGRWMRMLAGVLAWALVAALVQVAPARAAFWTVYRVDSSAHVTPDSTGRVTIPYCVFQTCAFASPPAAVVVTGNGPLGGVPQLPTNLIAYNPTTTGFTLRALDPSDPTGQTPITTAIDVWYHAASTLTQNEEVRTVTVTTDADGYATVGYASPHSVAPTAVVASGADPNGGGNIPVSLVVSARTATGFTVRALNQTGAKIASISITLSYYAAWAGRIDPGTGWVANNATTTVTTDANGYAMVSFAQALPTAPTGIVVVGVAPVGGGSIAAGLMADTATATGFRVRVANQTTGFVASQSVTLSYHAVAGSTRSVVPDSVDKRSMTPGDSADVGTTTPTLHGRFTDPDGGNGHVDFEVANPATGAVVASGAGATVASGSDSPWTVPAGKLAAATTYRWRARGNDGTGVGVWSAYKYFNTQAASLVGDQRRFSFEQRDLNDRLELKANVANGNLLLHATDLRIRGTGIDFTLDRYYNSRSTSTSALGKGWTLGVGQDVKLLLAASNPTTSDVTYVAPSGFAARFSYDTSVSPARWRHPPGVDADLSWNATSSEWKLTFQKSEGKFFFNSTGWFVREEDRNTNPNTISFDYNTSGLLATVTDTQNRQTTLAYVNGHLDTVTDPTGRTVHYTYNADGNLDTVTDTGGNLVRYRYNGDLIDQITTGANSITRLDYLNDGSRRIADHFTQYDPGNGVPTSATTSFAYTSGETKVTDPNGNFTTNDATDGITTYRYDDRDRVTKVIDALGHTQDKKYTSNDNVATVTDALQKQTILGWDPNDENLTSVSLPTGAKSTLEYTSTAHPHAPTKTTDPQGNTLSYTYDSPGNRDTTQSSAYPGVNIEDRDYNPGNGTISKITDGNGTITSFGYDTKGNLTSVNNPAPLGDLTLTPDALSRLKTKVDGKGQTTSYTYDGLDRQDVVTFQGGATVDRDYDADGNLTKLTDATGITTFAYDKMNRQTRKTLPDNTQLRYDYDHNGNLTQFTDAGGQVGYTYNQVNLLTQLLEPGATTPVTFTYDNDNRRKTTTYPTSPATVMTIGYDDSGRQTSVKATAGTTTLSSFTYNYQKNGADTSLRQSMTDPSGTTSYGYDGLNRLTGASGALSRGYGYDIDFNRTSKTEGAATTNYGYNAANELTSVNGTNTYNYDGNGNLTGGGGWSLSYNSKDQTTSITKPGGSALSPLAYAGADQTERVQAGATSFATSALGVSSATTSGGSVFYTRDAGGNLVSLRTASGSRYYYLFDGLGSVVGLVNSAGAKVNSYRYDPYGVQLSASETVANPWRYAAGFFDTQTGLTKFGTRYYDPALGRFTQRDPSGKDLPYAYAGCNPTNHVDPAGLQYLDVPIEACNAFLFLINTVLIGALGLPGAATVGAYAAGVFLGGVQVITNPCSNSPEDPDWGEFAAVTGP